MRYCFVTGNRWLLGRVRSDGREVRDLLNGAAPGSVVVEDVAIQSDVYAYRSGEQAEYTVVNPAGVLLVMAVEERSAGVEGDGLLADEPVAPARLGIGPYEVLGNVSLPREGGLANLLEHVEDRFIAVRKAVVRRVDAPSVLERREIVLVNRLRVDYVVPAPPLPLFGADPTHVLLD